VDIPPAFYANCLDKIIKVLYHQNTKRNTSTPCLFGRSGTTGVTSVQLPCTVRPFVERLTAFRGYF